MNDEPVSRVNGATGIDVVPDNEGGERHLKPGGDGRESVSFLDDVGLAVLAGGRLPNKCCKPFLKSGSRSLWDKDVVDPAGQIVTPDFRIEILDDLELGLGCLGHQTDGRFNGAIDADPIEC